jgi:hypothetical protein
LFPAAHAAGVVRNTLTPAGRKQLADERAQFERLVRAIRQVLEAT